MTSATVKFHTLAFGQTFTAHDDASVLYTKVNDADAHTDDAPLADSCVQFDPEALVDVEQLTTFVNTRTGATQTCRLDRLDACADDPMNDGAPMGDIYNDARRRDLRDGCPQCSGAVADNASEPDVMARWEL